MSDRVCAVVVTFNRKVLLGECLRGLMAQTHAPDRILVIDNASTDGTREMLAADFPKLELLALPENGGGSAGFHAGVKAAFERGYDWIWVMDDDVEPHPDCLEAMLHYRDFSGFIHVRREFQGKPVAWEGLWDPMSLEKSCFDRDISFDNGREWISVNYACFEGALIHRKTVERIGFPDPRFFIGGDDSIYGLLASFHTNVIYVNFVGIEKKLRPADPDYKRIYFVFRKKFLYREHMRANGIPVSSIMFWIGMGVQAFWQLRRPEIPFLAGAQSIWAGVRDGIRKRYGRPDWIPGPRTQQGAGKTNLMGSPATTA